MVRRLLASANPSIRFRTRTLLLDEDASGAPLQTLRREIAACLQARALLAHREQDGTIDTNPYKKWQGPLWTLVSLAYLDYPPGDVSLHPIRDQVYDWLLSPDHVRFPRSLLIPGQEDRFRRCGSQEGYAIWFTLKLGIADERTDELAARLMRWQWPDGGWNCDKRPQARLSSLIETFVPLRALACYGKVRGDAAALATARRAAEVLLSRRIFRRHSDGSVIHCSFTRLAYPYFYHYDLLSALVVLADAGFIGDPRCAEALDLLESKRLPDGGFPNEERTHVTSKQVVTRGTYADWGPVGKHQANEFVTLEALYALKAAGRFSPAIV